MVVYKCTFCGKEYVQRIDHFIDHHIFGPDNSCLEHNLNEELEKKRGERDVLIQTLGDFLKEITKQIDLKSEEIEETKKVLTTFKVDKADYIAKNKAKILHKQDLKELKVKYINLFNS